MARFEIDVEELAERVMELYSDSRSLDSVMNEVLDPLLPEGVPFSVRSKIFKTLKEEVSQEWYSRKEEYHLRRYGIKPELRKERSIRTRIKAGRLNMDARSKAAGAEVEARLDDIDNVA